VTSSPGAAFSPQTGAACAGGVQRMNRRRRVSIAALVCVLATLHTPAFARDDVDPANEAGEAIYERVRDVWSSQRPPAYLTYRIVVRVDDAGTLREAHYAAAYEPARDIVGVHAFSDEEAGHPLVARGIDVFVTIGLNRGTESVAQLSRDPAPTDYLGIPVLDPLYAFGIVRRASDTPAPPTGTSTAGAALRLQTIGRVVTKQRDYVVRLIGTESVEGHDAYHLRLTPLREPKRYRLRELWIDTQSSTPLELITDGNFEDGPSVGVPWTVWFETVDGVTSIARERAGARLTFDRHRRYDDATILFEELRSIPPPPFLIRHPRRGDDLREPPSP